MADKAIFKESIIECNPYPKRCFELLGQEKNFFVFGCSFQRDEHLLRVLLNTNNKNIYISYFTSDSYKEVKAKVESSDNFRIHNVFYVNCGGDQRKIVRDKLWQC